MQITVRVNGVEHEISPTAGDLVRLERQFKISAASMTEETTTVEHVMFLSWAALRRTEVLSRELEFDEFLDIADTPEGSTLNPPPPPPPRD